MQRYSDFVTEGTPAEDAELRVTRSQAHFMCRSCTTTSTFDLRSEAGAACAPSASRDAGLTSGHELRIQSIDVLRESASSSCRPCTTSTAWRARAQPTRFALDEDAITERLRGGKGAVGFDSATAERRNEDGTCAVETASGKTHKATSMVQATPADVATKIVELVVKLPQIRGASVLHAHLIRGRIGARYCNHIVHVFTDDTPIIVTARRKEGEYGVLTEQEVDLREYLDAHDVVECVHWPKAPLTNPNIVLDQGLDTDLYMAGDHSGPGMEPAAVSGIYAANRIAGRV